MSKVLGREFQFAAALKKVRVSCPELDCEFILRELTAAQAIEVRSSTTIQQLALMLVDDEGQRIYTTEADVDNLSQMSLTMMNRLLAAAAELNGLGSALEDAIKNSQAGRNGASESA